MNEGAIALLKWRTDEGLTQTSVHYAAPRSEAQVTAWLPFWVFEGRVHIKRRSTQGGGSEQAKVTRLWEEPRRLYVPAWELSLSEAQNPNLPAYDQASTPFHQ